jgi:catechol 2,3-dioxygenase
VGAPTPPKNSVGLNWYTLVFPNEEARSTVIKQLQQLGAPIAEEADFYGTNDPSGNQIRLVI